MWAVYTQAHQADCAPRLVPPPGFAPRGSSSIVLWTEFKKDLSDHAGIEIPVFPLGPVELQKLGNKSVSHISRSEMRAVAYLKLKMKCGINR